MDTSDNLCQEACDEFKILGYKKDINPRNQKESYNISRRPDGNWYKCTKLDLHSPTERIFLDFIKMPKLKLLTDLIDELDPEITRMGGRIFITETITYKIKRGTEYPIVINKKSLDDTAKSFQKYNKLCVEILNHGIEKDRFRVEETYIISKSSKGIWSASTNHTNLSGKDIIINLSKMPNLKLFANKLNKHDPAFETNGGRIFITPSRVYRIKNKIELDFPF